MGAERCGLRHQSLREKVSVFKSRTGEEQQRKNIESSSDRTASQQVSWRRSRHQRNSVRNLERKRCARPLPIQGSGQLSDEWRDPDGYGVGLHQTIYVIGYNSNLVPADAVPKGYEDLLNPRWKRQLAWDPEEYYLFGALMKARGKEKGLEFWHRLAEQQVNFRKGYTLITELLSAGEFPVTVSLDQHRVDEYIDKGAPVQWVAPNPLVGGDPNRIALLINAPRPSAAKIFIDFMLSVEGQKLLQDI